MYRDEAEAVRVVMRMRVEGNIGIERPKKRCLDEIKSDARVIEVIEKDVGDQVLWWCRTRLAVLASVL